jgi:hypothetical protein
LPKQIVINIVICIIARVEASNHKSNGAIPKSQMSRKLNQTIMRKFALTICMLSIVGLSFGQKTKEAKLDQGKMQLNVGVGLSTWGIPIYGGIDYWINDDVTIGIEGSFRYVLWYSYAVVGGSVNGNYHFNNILQLPENMDLYVGLSAGPYFYLDNSIDRLHFGIGGQLGGRYKINDKMWVQVELGGGTLSGAKIGLTFRR